MRILFVLPYVPSLIRVRPYNFIRQLAQRHEVTVLATDSSRCLADAEQLRSYCRDVQVVPLRLPEALRSCVVGALRGDPLQAAFCRSPQLEHTLVELLSAERFDLVHVEHLRAAHLGALLPAALPKVYDAVDCISLLLERTLASSHSWRQRLLAAVELQRCRAYESRTLRLFDGVAVTSPEDQSALESLPFSVPRGPLAPLVPPARVDVIPNGVDLNYFHPLVGTRELATLVFSGKMSYHANVTALLHFYREIFPSIRRRHTDVRLWVIGSKPPTVVKGLARDPAVSVTGFLPDIRPALGRATVALCPVTVKVGIQNKLLEAMAMGLPVVSTSEGVQGLSVQPGRDLLVASNPEEFADHVCRLLSDPDLRKQIGQAGRGYVENYHRWEDAAAKLEGLYAEAIGTMSRSGHAGLMLASPLAAREIA